MMNDVVGRFVIFSPFWADVLNNFKQEMNMFSCEGWVSVGEAKLWKPAPIVPPVAGVQEAPTGLHCGLRTLRQNWRFQICKTSQAYFLGWYVKLQLTHAWIHIMVFSCVFQQMIVPSTTSMSRGFPGWNHRAPPAGSVSKLQCHLRARCRDTWESLTAKRCVGCCITGWWFGTFGLFFHILGMSYCNLNWRTHIFQRGRLKPPTRSCYCIPSYKLT